MADGRRKSIGAIEMTVKKAEWVAKHKKIEAAKVYFEQDNNLVTAKSVCQEVLRTDPGFFPAQQLMREINKKESMLVNDSVCEASLGDSLESEDIPSLEFTALPSSASESDDEDAAQTRNKTSTPVRKRGILKKKVTLVDAPSVISSKSQQASTKPRDIWSEAVLENIIVKAQARMITPAQMLESLPPYRHTENHYICPKKACGKSRETATVLITHYVRRHKPELNGKPMRPFFCKTCPESFDNSRHLITHGKDSHPRSRWLPDLESLVNAEL